MNFKVSELIFRFILSFIITIFCCALYRKHKQTTESVEYQLNCRRLTPKGQVLVFLLLAVFMAGCATLIHFQNAVLLSLVADETSKAVFNDYLRVVSMIMSLGAMIFSILAIINFSDREHFESMDGLTFRYIDLPEEKQKEIRDRYMTSSEPANTAEDKQ